MTVNKGEGMPKVEKETAGLVAVEMTEAEKEQFTKYMAEQKSKAEKAKDSDEIIEVDLRFPHRVNQKHYGPGKVTVKSGLGYMLLQQDDQAMIARMKVHESSGGLIEIMGRGISKVRKVGPVS